MDLPVGDAFVIPEGELEWRFSTSGGPGGQHANRNATRAELSWDLSGSSVVPDQVRHQLARRLHSHLRNGVVTVAAGESRSQWRNRQMARRRLADLVGAALRPEQPRVPTRPTRSAREERLESKRRRSATKRLRKPPEWE